MPLEQKIINEIIELIYSAGSVAKDFFYRKNINSSKKSDNTIFCDADLAVEDFIIKGLALISPSLPIISEEQAYQQQNLQKKIATNIGEYWLLDPIDGSNSFINHCNEFAISLALISNGKPIFGILYAPLFNNGEIIYSNNDKIYQINNLKSQSWSGLFSKQKLITSNNQANQEKDSLIIVASKRARKAEIADFFSNCSADLEINYSQYRNKIKCELEIIKISSAIKFIRLANNEADIFLQNQQTMPWDTAAGQAIIEKLDKKIYLIEPNLESYKIINSSLCYLDPFKANQKFLAF
jgi:3'(2'), 5'-bisphosphate nucleotidase